MSCSEIYEYLNDDSRQRQQVALAGIAIFHEALHNLLPGWGMEEMPWLDQTDWLKIEPRMLARPATVITAEAR